MATVIDELIARFRFEANRGDLASIERGLENVKKGARAVGTAFIAMGAALTAVSVLTIKTFADFETKMATIEALVGIPAETLKAWEPAIKKIAIETGQSLGDIADGLFFITSAGLRGKEALEVTEAVSKAVTAGLGDFTTLAKIATGAMELFGITADDALDSVAKAIEIGKLDADKLGVSLQHILPLAKALGIPFDDILGLMASLSLAELTPEKSATGLAQALQLVINPSSQAKKALQDYGYSAGDLRDILAGENGLVNFLLLLMEMTDGNIESLAQLFPGVEALIPVLAATGDNIDLTIRLQGEMENRTGKLEQAFQVMADTLNVKFKQAVIGAQSLLIGMGDAMSESVVPALDQVLVELRFLSGAFENAEPWVKRLMVFTPVLAVGLIVVGAALHGLAFALGPLGKLLIGTIHLFTTFARAMANVILTAIRMAVMLVGAAARGIFTVARAALLGTGAITRLRIALLRLGIAANLSSIMMRVALIPAILQGAIPAFTAMARAAWASLGPYLPIVLGVIVAINALLVALGYVVQNWDKITKAAGSAWQIVIDGLGMILEVGEPIVTAFANLWLNQLTFIGNAFKTWLDLVLSGLSSLIGAMDWVSGKLGLDLGLGDVKNKIDEIRTAVGEFDVGEFVGNIPEHIKNLATAAVQEIGKGIEAAAGAASTAVQPVINVVQDVAAAHQTGREALSGLLPNMDSILEGAPFGLPAAPTGAAGITGREALSELLPNVDAILQGAPFGLPVAPEGAAAMMRGGAGGQSMLGDADRALLQEIRDAIRDEGELAGQRGIQINELRVDVSAVGNPRDIGRNVATDLTDQFEALGFDLEGNIAR